MGATCAGVQFGKSPRTFNSVFVIVSVSISASAAIWVLVLALTWILVLALALVLTLTLVLALTLHQAADLFGLSSYIIHVRSVYAAESSGEFVGSEGAPRKLRPAEAALKISTIHLHANCGQLLETCILRTHR